MIPAAVSRLDLNDSPITLHLEDGRCVKASTVVVATGARYRRLEVPILQSFEGRGVLGFADSGASVSERGSCSARRRQFGGPGRRVPAQVRKKILQRGRSGSATYFVRDPAHAPASSIDNIEVLTHTEVVALYGSREGQLERVLWRNNLTGKGTERPIRHVFLFIGRIRVGQEFPPDGIGRSLQRRPVERRVWPFLRTVRAGQTCRCCYRPRRRRRGGTAHGAFQRPGGNGARGEREWCVAQHVHETANSLAQLS
jgi:hypothetical protein